MGCRAICVLSIHSFPLSLVALFVILTFVLLVWSSVLHPRWMFYELSVEGRFVLVNRGGRGYERESYGFEVGVFW